MRERRHWWFSHKLFCKPLHKRMPEVGVKSCVGRLGAAVCWGQWLLPFISSTEESSSESLQSPPLWGRSSAPCLGTQHKIPFGICAGWVRAGRAHWWGTWLFSDEAQSPAGLYPGSLYPYWDECHNNWKLLWYLNMWLPIGLVWSHSFFIHFSSLN